MTSENIEEKTSDAGFSGLAGGNRIYQLMTHVHVSSELRAYNRICSAPDRPDSANFVDESRKDISDIRDRDIREFVRRAQNIIQHTKEGDMTLSDANNDYHRNYESLLDDIDEYIAQLEEKRKDLHVQIYHVNKQIMTMPAFVLRYIVETKDYKGGEGEIFEIETRKLF